MYGAAVACGIPADRLLRAGMVERQALLELASAAGQFNAHRDDVLARRIIATLGEAMK